MHTAHQAAANAPQPTGRERSSYIPGLDGIRAIAFLLVFWAHGTPGVVSHFIPATLGVTIFFFLSGFLITTLLRKEVNRTGTIALRDFYIRRTLRIFIPLYVVYALTLVVGGYFIHEGYGNRFGGLSLLFYFYNYANVLHAHAYLPAGIDVVWSLAVEEHFYILFPLAYLIMVRRRFSAALQAKLLLGFCLLELLWRVVLVVHFHQAGNWTYFATDARLDSILWGCLLALNNNPLYRNSSNPDRSILPRGREKLVFGLAVFGMALSLMPTAPLYREAFRYTLQAMLLYVIFSFVLSNISHWSVRWLEWTPLRYIGWISYVLYLSHHFILYTFERFFPNHILATALASFAVSLAVASILRYTLELPLQKLRARFRHVPEADPTAADHHGLVS